MHRLPLANSMIEINEMTKSGIGLSRFRQEVATVKAEYAEPRSLKWAPLAVQAGLSNLYELSYRLPSGDGAHVTLAAIHRHFDKDEHEYFIGMLFQPAKSDLHATLLAANAAFVHPLGLAQELMGLNHFEAEYALQAT